MPADLMMFQRPLATSDYIPVLSHGNFVDIYYLGMYL